MDQGISILNCYITIKFLHLRLRSILEEGWKDCNRQITKKAIITTTAKKTDQNEDLWSPVLMDVPKNTQVLKAQ